MHRIDFGLQLILNTLSGNYVSSFAKLLELDPEFLILWSRSRNTKNKGRHDKNNIYLINVSVLHLLIHDKEFKRKQWKYPSLPYFFTFSSNLTGIVIYV